MRINEHIVQTFFLGLILFFPLATLFVIIPTFLGTIIVTDASFWNSTFPQVVQYQAYLSIFLGLIIGTIYPDADNTMSSIFKPFNKGKVSPIKNVLSIFIYTIYALSRLVIGIFLRFFIYLPSIFISRLFVKKYTFSGGHRTLSHSLFGVFISSLIFTFLAFFINLIFRFHSEVIFVLSASFFVGGIIHLFQDSISVSGVKWFYPFKDTRVSGEYSSFDNKDRRMTFVNTSLFILFIVNLYLTIWLIGQVPKFITDYANFFSGNVIGIISLYLLAVDLPPLLILFLIYYILSGVYAVKIDRRNVMNDNVIKSPEIPAVDNSIVNNQPVKVQPPQWRLNGKRPWRPGKRENHRGWHRPRRHPRNRQRR